MARTPLTVTTLEGAYGDYGVGEADITMAAADVGNGNEWTLKEDDVLVAHNTAVGAQTLTVTSSPDEKGRSGDITTYSLAADDYGAFGPFKAPGWVQAGNLMYVDATDVGIKLGVLRQR